MAKKKKPALSNPSPTTPIDGNGPGRWNFYAVIGAALIAAAAAGVGLWYQHWAKQPHLSGMILHHSWGEKPGSGLTSVVVYVSLANTGEASVVPTAYDLDAKVDGTWTRLKLVPKAEPTEQLTMGFEDATTIGHPGVATARFPAKSYLTSRAAFNVPILKDQHRSGILQFTTQLSADSFRHPHLNALRLAVTDAAGNRHAIDAVAGSRSPAEIQQREPDMEFAPGMQGAENWPTGRK